MDTFEEIVNKLAKQENPHGIYTHNIYTQGFLRACRLLRPLLDGWKDAEEEPVPHDVIIWTVNKHDVFMEGRIEVLTYPRETFSIGFMTSGAVYNAKDIKYWRLPSLPGDYSALEALITNKK